MAKNVKINGVTYQDVPQVEIPLAEGNDSATFYDTSDASIDGSDSAKVRNGESVYGPNGKVVGTMTENNAVSADISTKDGTVSIPAGFHKGVGSVGLDATEKAKLIAANIKSGITMFGVSGKASVVDTDDATAAAAQILSGYSAYVNGQKIPGSLTAASVSQDSTTKVLTIS